MQNYKPNKNVLELTEPRRKIDRLAIFGDLANLLSIMNDITKQKTNRETR